MTDLTSRRLDCIKYLPHNISNACSLIDPTYVSSVGHILTLFMLLKVKEVFVIHGFEFRYMFLDEKFPSCIKEPQHEENNIVTVYSRFKQRDKDSFKFTGRSPCFNCFNR